MPVTVVANGLTISHKGSGGYEINSTPDVCKTPGNGVPVAYSIRSESANIVRGSVTVFADGENSIDIKGSAHVSCTGDEAGSMKGVVSGTNVHESTWITYSPTVYIEGKNICRLSDKMFMNNKNCISGDGGHRTSTVVSPDEILVELCEIFCAAREEWLDCKHRGSNRPCDKPSKLAQRRVDADLASGGRLSQAVQRRVPGGFGAAERTLYTLGDKALDGVRKFYDRQGLRNALERAVRSAAARAGGTAVARMGRRAWMKLVPGLNLLGTALDIYEGAVLATDIIGAIRESSQLFDDAIRVQPDVSIHNADGSVHEIYDFKFDDPIDGYQDDLNMDTNQRGIYERMGTESRATDVTDDRCGCRSKHSQPSAGTS